MRSKTKADRQWRRVKPTDKCWCLDCGKTGVSTVQCCRKPSRKPMRYAEYGFSTEAEARAFGYATLLFLSGYYAGYKIEKKQVTVKRNDGRTRRITRWCVRVAEPGRFKTLLRSESRFRYEAFRDMSRKRI